MFNIQSLDDNPIFQKKKLTKKATCAKSCIVKFFNNQEVFILLTIYIVLLLYLHK